MNDKMVIVDDSDKKRIAFVMMITGAILWFLMDATKPLARDLMKGLCFLLFGYGAIVLSKQKPWSQLSEREKKMKMIFIGSVISLLIIIVAIMFILARA